MPSPILVGLALREDDAAPLALARALARLENAPLALLTALPHEAPGFIPAPELTLMLQRDAAEQLDAVAAPLRAEHDVRTIVRMGSPARALHDAAEQLGAAVVVVGSTHRGRVGRVLAGDVAAGLLHGAPCPVVVAPRGFAGDRQLARIAVAYTDNGESRAALDAAAVLARRAGAEIHLLSAVEPPPWTVAAAAPGLLSLPDFEEERREQTEQAAQHALATLPEELQGAVEVLPGGDAVVALAEASERFDLLVSGSRGYGAVRSVLAGGVSRGLAHEARCPLLVVPRTVAAHPTAAAA
jgi:nucleotide-binding universal stress UspA family protein